MCPPIVPKTIISPNIDSAKTHSKISKYRESTKSSTSGSGKRQLNTNGSGGLKKITPFSMTQSAAQLSPLKKQRLDSCVANTRIFGSFVSSASKQTLASSGSSAGHQVYLSPIKNAKIPRNASTDTRQKQRDSSMVNGSRNSKLPAP